MVETTNKHPKYYTGYSLLHAYIIYIYALLPQYQDIGDPGWQCGLKERGSSVYL